MSSTSLLLSLPTLFLHWKLISASLPSLKLSKYSLYLLIISLPLVISLFLSFTNRHFSLYCSPPSKTYLYLKFSALLLIHPSYCSFHTIIRSPVFLLDIFRLFLSTYTFWISSFMTSFRHSVFLHPFPNHFNSHAFIYIIYTHSLHSK